MSSPIQQQLRRLADEIRVQMHLAGMEAKAAWSQLEPRLHEYERKAEKTADKVGEELTHVGQQLQKELSDLLDRVKKS